MKIKTCVLALALAGCATPQQRAQDLAAERAAYKAYLEQQIETVWGPQCQEMGVDEKTNPDGWGKCVMKLGAMDGQRQMAAAQASDARRMFWAQTLQNIGNTAYGPAATYNQQIHRQQTDCRPDQFGGFSCVTR